MVASSFMARPTSSLMPPLLKSPKIFSGNARSFPPSGVSPFRSCRGSFRILRDEIPSEEGEGRREENDSAARVTLIRLCSTRKLPLSARRLSPLEGQEPFLFHLLV